MATGPGLEKGRWPGLTLLPGDLCGCRTFRQQVGAATGCGVPPRSRLLAQTEAAAGGCRNDRRLAETDWRSLTGIPTQMPVQFHQCRVQRFKFFPEGVRGRSFGNQTGNFVAGRNEDARFRVSFGAHADCSVHRRLFVPDNRQQALAEVKRVVRDTIHGQFQHIGLPPGRADHPRHIRSA